MRRPVSSGMRYAPNVRRAQGTKKRRPAMKKTSTVRGNGNMILKGHKLTIGLDLGDRWSFYCVLDEAGQIILEQKLPTTPEAMKQTFGKIPRSLIEVLWPTTAQVWHLSGEREAGRGIERGVARGSGAAVERNRIAERAHPGIRRADGENRQGSVPASVLAQAGEGRRNTDRSDVCPDDRGPLSVC